MLELPLPEINMARVHIVFDDQVSHANAAALTFGEDHWRKVEAPFLAGERPLQHGALAPVVALLPARSFVQVAGAVGRKLLDARSGQVHTGALPA